MSGRPGAARGGAALGLWLVAALPGPAAAAAAEPALELPAARELLDGVKACAAVAEPSARLTCFDGLADRVQGVEALSDEDRRVEPVRAFSAQVLRLQQRPHGEWVLYLSNGEVWTELEPSRVRYKEGMTVRIHRGALGGYRLSSSFGRSTRVRKLD